VERQADDPGELTDFLSDEEVVLHEAFDRAQAGMAAIAEPLGHQRLHIEAQAFLRTVSEEMQLTAHRPKETLAAAEASIFCRREHARLDELLLGGGGIKMLGKPVQRVQVAQAAFAVLDVRLDQIARCACAGVAGILLFELCVDESPGMALEHFFAKAALELAKQHLIAKD